jgi:hypothetical protein
VNNVGIISDNFKKTQTPPIPLLKEKYPDTCIETTSTRKYLEEFFDINNNALMHREHIRIIPNCSHCRDQFRCAIGIHALNHMKFVEHLDNYSPLAVRNMNSDKPSKNEEVSGDKPRFSNLIE